MTSWGPFRSKSHQSESCLLYNDSQMSFYVDEQHDLKHYRHPRGQFLCSLRCEQRAKEISNHKKHCSFKHYKVSFELQQCILLHKYFNFAFLENNNVGFAISMDQGMDLDVLYMQDLTHLTCSVTRRGRSGSSPHFKGEETEVTS